jgi:hypothetical protein
MRIKMEGVKSITTARMEISLSPGQCFYKTQKAWEVWDVGESPKRVKRIPSKSVYWVFGK